MKIGIFTAMKKEAESFLNDSVTKISVCEFDIYLFKMGVHDAVLCCPPNIGEIAAASACQLLISKFNVDVILNFGIVGALSEQTKLFSTVYVGSVVHYDFDVSPIDRLPIGRYAAFDDVAVSCDLSIVKRALSVADFPVVRCASGDKFVADSAKKATLRENFGAEICDMESAGILFTCKYNNIPCLLVKCVSDSLNDAVRDYEANALSASKNFFLLAEKIVSKL